MTVDYAPRKLRRICIVLAVLVVVVFGVVAVFLPAGGGATYGTSDQVAFFCIGVLVAAGDLALTRFRVRADQRGIWVRNTLGERYFPWEVVVGIDLPKGATWAQLELHDDELVAVLALQVSDGDAVVDTILELRSLLKQSRGG